ncbi:HET-domain-containing protein [Suillus weaverae]|nr:HET-domain-containing protein [Suillus weaverae]
MDSQTPYAPHLQAILDTIFSLIAIFYLWGGTGEEYWTTRANLKQRKAQGDLDISVLPGTILDTIQLVRRLGERYLWIDVLCIVQDDPKAKTAQIGVMELIHGSSEVFAVFATGGTSNIPQPSTETMCRLHVVCMMAVQKMQEEKQM